MLLPCRHWGRRRDGCGDGRETYEDWVRNADRTAVVRGIKRLANIMMLRSAISENKPKKKGRGGGKKKERKKKGEKRVLKNYLFTRANQQAKGEEASLFGLVFVGRCCRHSWKRKKKGTGGRRHREVRRSAEDAMYSVLWLTSMPTSSACLGT